MQNSNRVDTAMLKMIYLIKKMLLSTLKEIKVIKGVPYQEAVRKLLYLICASCTDIAFAVSVLYRYNNNPGHEH